MVIYVDILLALNGWLDFLLLLGVRRFSGGEGRPWRLALGALLGALFSLTLLLPSLPLVWSLMLKLMAAIAMVLVAFRWQVRVTVGAQSEDVLCLYDSGNHLVEPFSGLPVLVLEREVAQRLVTVPASVAQLPAGWRVIPFQSIGGEGVLPAFLPDGLARMTPSGYQELGGCYIAVCDRLGRGEYRGLAGSALGDSLAESGVKGKCFTDL